MYTRPKNIRHIYIYININSLQRRPSRNRSNRINSIRYARAVIENRHRHSKTIVLRLHDIFAGNIASRKYVWKCVDPSIGTIQTERIRTKMLLYGYVPLSLGSYTLYTNIHSGRILYYYYFQPNACPLIDFCSCKVYIGPRAAMTSRPSAPATDEKIKRKERKR